MAHGHRARGAHDYEPGSILAGLIMPIGDVIFSQPAVAGLRRRFPHARLTALVTAARAPLIAMNPDIDDLIVYDDTTEHNSLTRLDLTLQEIVPRRFDMLVSFSTGSNCVGLLSGIPRQYWQRLPFVFWVWGSALDPGYRTRHAVEHYWRVMAQLDVAPRGPADHVPRWHVSADEHAAARARLAAMGVDWRSGRPVVAFLPGALGFGGRKRWPAERFGELAAHLIQEDDAQVVVFGGPDDVDLAATIARVTGGRAISLAGQTTIRESVAMMASVSLCVANDTGLAHAAVALDVACVMIYGVSNLAQFGPRPSDPRRVQVVLPGGQLAPAGFYIGTVPPLTLLRQQSDDRLATISVEQVLAAVRAVWRKEEVVPGG